jgi:serine protease Do
MPIEKQISRTVIIFLVILSFVAGVVGSAAGIAIISNSSTLQKALGVSRSNLPLPQPSNIQNIKVQEDSAVVDSVNKVSSSVVSVVFTQNVQVINPFDFGSGSGSGVQQQQGGGSGFILTTDGLIATNRHVAEVAGAKYTVITSDGKKYDATVAALDPGNDFALLKIDAKNLPVVEFGDSDSLEIGQRVIAIGNALGEFQNSVTVGVVSGKERNLQASDSVGSQGETLEGLLQTDAAINAGNSGGPLVNLKGQVIGMNTATAAKSQAEGIGFAIPINSLKSAIDSYKKSGRIIVAYLGVGYVAVDQKIQASQGLKTDHGALVRSIQANSPAIQAGLKEGDVIMRINNDEITENLSLASILGKYQPGDEVTLKVLRDGNQIDVKVKLAEMPAS